MLWEILLLGGLITTIAGIAFAAMRKTRQTEFNSFSKGETIDTDKLAAKIARAIGAELREVLKEFKDELKTTLPVVKGYDPRKSILSDANEIISMDESIIPTKIETTADLTNLENMGKEEVQVDKGLEKSKSKLAGLLKRKEKE